MTTPANHQTYRRAAGAALLGLATQLLIALAMALLALYGQAPALYAATWLLFAGLAIWLILWLTYKQHEQERLEALEAEQLAQSDEQAARLFDEAGQQLAVARRRLTGFYKFGLNGISLLTAVYLLAAGAMLLWANDLAGPPLRDAAGLSGQAQPLPVIFLTFALAFIAFIVGRYVSGMTRLDAWQLLRGGAGFLMGSALISALLTAAAIASFFGQPAVLAVMAIVIPAFMIVLGIEYLLALLLSIYRPRQSGEPMRPAFDSRILGWLSSPESIGRIISETLNYQFGFEISRSWFYQLLARAVTPLIVTAALVLIALSSLVIVPPHQQAVITTFGAMAGDPVGPGLHLKWPWPVGHAEKYDTARVKTLELGASQHGEEQTFEKNHDHGAHQSASHLLWTDQGASPDGDYLITAPPTFQNARGISSAFGELVGARIRVKYKIGDLQQYVTSATTPEQLLADLADREMNAYFATRTIDTILSHGRRRAGEVIQQRLQKAVNQHNLGLAVTYVGLTHVHPPQGKGVIEAFHEKVAALQQQQTRIAEARKQAVQTLASVAGSRQHAMAIGQARLKLSEMQSKRRTLRRQTEDTNDTSPSRPSPGNASASPSDRSPKQQLASLDKKIAEQKRHIETLIQDAGGEAARILAEARAYRWTRPLASQGKAIRFAAQLEAFQQAPSYYRMRAYLDVLGRTLQQPRKFIMTAEAKVPPTIRLNLESAGSPVEQLMGESRP
jgi:regulator of protease activity HflC (stomatin/prohibitin superfamily)